MVILGALRDVMKVHDPIIDLAEGGIFIDEVSQDAKRPNIMMMVVGGVARFNHQGSDGLQQDRIRVYSRADRVRGASELSLAVYTFLNDKRDTVANGCEIQLIQHTNRQGDSQNGSHIFRAIDDYSVHYCYI